MKIEDFTQDPEILQILEELNTLKTQNPEKFIFSDISDAQGNQYVDLVQEGGGMLGIALVGYTYILEKAGLRFLSLAGTSAGAINTILMGAAAKPNEPKSEKIIQELANKNFYDFVDGDRDAKNFVNALVQKKSKFRMGLAGIQIIDNLNNDIGLNPGEAFVEWIQGVLESYKVNTTEDLINKMHNLPPEVQEQINAHKDKAANTELHNKHKDFPIAVVAADLTTKTKAIFPEMADLYFDNYLQESPAAYVRASMSVPLFFVPFEVEDIPKDDNKSWVKKANYSGTPPEKVTFVDGGILSNFPINIWHVRDREPSRPTFGIRLGLGRNSSSAVNGVFTLLGSCFDSARQMADADFILDNPDYKQVVGNIDTGDHNWLNFGMTDPEKLDLFRRGAQGAWEFLQRFDWQAYKKVRRGNLLAVVSNVLGGSGEEFEASLGRAHKLQDFPLDETDKEVLMRRIEFLKLNKSGYRVLWIDDNDDDDDVEIKLLKLLKMNVDIVTSSQAAQDALNDPEVEYDLIISDVDREGNKKEGLDFLKKIKESGQEVPPTIFYLIRLNPTKGVPPYAFGITNSPVELIHLVLDILQRS